jgi:hypothetical protein
MAFGGGTVDCPGCGGTSIAGSVISIPWRVILIIGGVALLAAIGWALTQPKDWAAVRLRPSVLQ